MSGDGLLVLNAGSSSIKFSLYAEEGETPRLLFRGQVADIGDSPSFVARDGEGAEVDANVLRGDETDHAAVLDRLLGWIEGNAGRLDLRAAGHRVVHGGPKYTTAIRLNDDIIAELRQLIPLAPLHQPHNLAAIDALRRLYPDLPQVACFDTAFHRTQPRMAQLFALPRELTEEGVTRYGFHGLSYEYIADVLPEFAGERADGRAVVAHLGHGASICAMMGRKSVATTMGFTALEGLPMGRRPGSLDPGVVLYLLQRKKMTPEEVADLLYHRCGLKGVSDISDDMQDLLASSAREAQDAIALFCYRAGRELGSLAATLGGLDVLVFTAGIGENAGEIRRRICLYARWLGVELDGEANAEGRARISRPDSRVAVYVVPTDEERVIAGYVRKLG
jgi:acetate kinase